MDKHNMHDMHDQHEDHGDHSGHEMPDQHVEHDVQEMKQEDHSGHDMEGMDHESHEGHMSMRPRHRPQRPRDDVPHPLLVELAAYRPGAALQLRPAKLAGLQHAGLPRQQLDLLHLLAGHLRLRRCTLPENGSSRNPGTANPA